MYTSLGIVFSESVIEIISIPILKICTNAQSLKYEYFYYEKKYSNIYPCKVLGIEKYIKVSRRIFQ